MNKVILIIISCFFLSQSLSAQYNTVSPYSRYGIGNLESQVLGRAIGMGGISTGVRLPFEINIENPASYTAVPNKVFLFQVGLKAKRTDFETVSNNVSNYDVWLSSINAAFRVHKYWGMSIGLNPLSSVGYDIHVEDSAELNGYKAEFDNYYTGEGGLSKITFGNSLNYKGVSAGVNASYIFGPIVKNLQSALSEQNYISVLNDNENIKVNDFHLRYGIQYSDSVFKKHFFTVGAIFETETNLNARLIRFTTRELELENNIEIKDTLINDTVLSGEIGLPMMYGFGFTYTTTKFIFGVDYKTSKWQDVKFFGESTNYLTNSNEISVGAEYTDDYASKQYIKTINFRAGARYSNTQLKLNDKQIKEYGFTLGAGFPIGLGTKINLAFEIGKKGTVEDQLIMENYYLMHLNFNMTDNWFIRRKFF
jgi:hypothetical protein